MRRQPHNRKGSDLKQLIALLVLAFLVTLGVVIGTRLSTDAIGVLVGVIAGVAASIPTALLLMVVTRRRDGEGRQGRDEARHSAPPVIVVTPGNAVPPGLPYHAPYPYGASLPQGPRQFRVMGCDDEDDQLVSGQTGLANWDQAADLR